MSLWILFLLNMCAFLRGNALVASTPSTRTQNLHGCCEDGKQRAQAVYSCTDLPRISNSIMCRIAQEQCCEAVLEELLCDEGTSMALWQSACERHFFRGEPWQTRILKMCCDCCMFGVTSARHDPSCGMAYVSLGKRCTHAAKSCCAKNRTEEIHPTGEGPVNVTRLPLVALGNCTVSNCSQICTDNGMCACRVGYQLQFDGVTCEDMNECLIGSHNCLFGQACINTEGSFRCQRETSCGTGYELTDSNQCQDIDECALRMHNCGLDFLCNNTEGSFRCHPREKCDVGFIQDAVGSCIDINECVAHSSPCQPGHTCVNTPGSYMCRRDRVTCGRGYHLNTDGTRCEDVDECQTGNACGDHGCVNMMGTYRCDCRSGFVFNSVGRQCEDINECRHYPGRLCAHRCVNTEGSYQCSCSKGFQLSHDDRSCEDVNECEDSPCGQECANTYGSYQCYCRRGYQLSGTDGKTCEDIDECALPTGGHVCSYRCSNAPGSFYCTCPPMGYTLAANGRTCQDIDECAAGSHTCAASQSCFNIHGGYRCLSLVCPSYYRKVAHGRCERVTCEFTRDPPSCFSLPLRISFYNVTLPADTPVPADVFRMGPSNLVPGDQMMVSIASGDEQGYFAVQQQQAYGGVILLRRALAEPRDFFLTVEMRLTRYGTSHLYVAKIAVFVTREQPSQPL
ncbi:fibulin-1-like isoform X2 [Dunckerocampus dactyliophorus]|uniref:fibulin-1-like isoform X2 n=1 Tax=Dunckerocampus dactyliophorus TaxID=161453 RepID=UPI00240673FC|nr:fibulin-1-like isoform X2 [Dunckerocampus dactyliophorus]